MNITTKELQSLIAHASEEFRKLNPFAHGVPQKKPRTPRFKGQHSRHKAWVLEQLQGPGLFFPMRTVSEANNRDHYQEKGRRARRQRITVTAELINHFMHRERPKLPVVVKLTRYGPKLADDDNRGGSLKATRDAVAKFLGVDDGDRDAVAWEYADELAPPKCWGVRIEFRSRLDFPTALSRTNARHGGALRKLAESDEA